MIFQFSQKKRSGFYCDQHILIFEKLGSVGPVKLKINLEWPKSFNFGRTLSLSLILKQQNLDNEIA